MALGFSRGVTHFYGSTLAMTVELSRISKTNLETSVEYSQPPCLFFFLEQTTDRQIDLLFWLLRYPGHFIALELLAEPPQNKICYRLHPKYTSFSRFPIIARLQSESLYFNKVGVTYAIFDALKEAD